MTDRTDDPTARKELASSLREVLRSEQNREYARAFCRAVLVNFRTGLMVGFQEEGRFMSKKKAKKTLATADELAQAVREERMGFDDALLEYLTQHHPDSLDVSFVMVMKITIGYAAMGEWNKKILFSEVDTLTVKQIIERFGLAPFVEQNDVVRHDPDAIP